MNIPNWIKPAVYGVVIGGVAVAIVGFSWGGWVTGGTATASAASAADQSRTDLAAAICAQNFMADDNAREQLVALKAQSSSFQRREFLEAGGWAMMPDNDAAQTATLTLCARMLAALEPEELPLVDDGEVIEPGEVDETDAPVEPAAPIDEEPAAVPAE